VQLYGLMPLLLPSSTNSLGFIFCMPSATREGKGYHSLLCQLSNARTSKLFNNDVYEMWGSGIRGHGNPPP